MKVIIADSFVKKYNNVVSLINLEKLSKKIKEIRLITLKYPYLKLRLIIGGIAIRGVLLKTKGGNIVFIILCFKKDKNCGENIIFDKMKKQIFAMEEKILEDIKNKNFIVF